MTFNEAINILAKDKETAIALTRIVLEFDNIAKNANDLPEYIDTTNDVIIGLQLEVADKTGMNSEQLDEYVSNLIK